MSKKYERSFRAQHARGLAAGIALLPANIYYPAARAGETVLRRVLLAARADADGQPILIPEGGTIEGGNGEIVVVAEVANTAGVGVEAAAYLDALGVPPIAEEDPLLRARAVARAGAPVARGAPAQPR